MALAEKPISIFDNKNNELRELRLRHKQLQTYLAIARYELEQSKEQTAILESEGWESKRRRQKGEVKYPLTPPSTPHRANRQIKSYRNAIRRTSDKLLFTATARRRYRAFNDRGTSSLSSNEAVARNIKRWLNEERDRRRNFYKKNISDDGRVSLDSPSNSSSDEDSSSDPGAIAKMAEAAVEDADVFRGGPSSGQPNQPAAPDPYAYNPDRWTSIPYAQPFDGRRLGGPAPFEQPQDKITPTGWLTWKEQDEQYPTLDKVLKTQQVNPDDLWDLDWRVNYELEKIKDPMKRPRVEPTILTKLSLERGYARERPEMSNPLYEAYSQEPATLPPKLSDEEMNRGPQPVPPRLPLNGPIGPEIDLRPKPAETPRVRKDWQKALDRFDPEAATMKLPASKYEYRPDHSTTSTFRFPDGKGVADYFKPGPLDEPDLIRGSQELADFGLQIAEQERAVKVPYRYSTRPAPGLPPPKIDTPTPMSEAETQAHEEKVQKSVAERLQEAVRSHVEQRQLEASGKATIPVAGRPGVFTYPPPDSSAEEAVGKAMAEGASRGIKRRRERSNSFHHYENLADHGSSVHQASGTDDNPAFVPPQPPPETPKAPNLFKKNVRFDIPKDK